VTSRAQNTKYVTVYLNCKFHENYIPSIQIATDESTAGFKCRIVFKICNSNQQSGGYECNGDCETGYISSTVP
jgi:hypothetical protein